MYHFPVRISGEALSTSGECARIVHQKQVNVRGIEIGERLVEGSLNIFWVVIVAPKLRSEKDIFPRDTASFDALADLLLDVVDSGCVDKAEARFQSTRNGIFLGLGILKGAKPNCWDLGSRVERVLGLASRNPSSLGNEGDFTPAHGAVPGCLDDACSDSDGAHSAQ